MNKKQINLEMKGTVEMKSKRLNSRPVSRRIWFSRDNELYGYSTAEMHFEITRSVK